MTDDPNNNPFQNKHADTQGMGKGMIMIAWIIAIAFLTYIFAGVEERQNNPNPSPSSEKNESSIEVELKRNRLGHYIANGEIDHKEVVFLLDTGATSVAIPGSLENYLNLNRGQKHLVNTANGTAVAYDTKIGSIQIGEIVLYNVKASINPSMEGEEILLGMSALKQIEFRQKGNRLTLIQDLR
ncbi:MAG: aspartyl protease family protein [Polaribacter sp.]|jgi:aspartyl protease family protein